MDFDLLVNLTAVVTPKFPWRKQKRYLRGILLALDACECEQTFVLQSSPLTQFSASMHAVLIHGLSWFGGFRAAEPEIAQV